MFLKSSKPSGENPLGFSFLKLTMLTRASIIKSMNKLTTQDREKVVSCLVEGNSIRATVRMTGVAKNTVTKLLVDLGKACSAYQDKIQALFCGLACRPSTRSAFSQAQIYHGAVASSGCAGVADGWLGQRMPMAIGYRRSAAGSCTASL